MPRIYLLAGFLALLAAAVTPAQNPRTEPPKPVPSSIPEKLSGVRWQSQYFYDKSKEILSIRDLRFASPARGVAVGELLVEKGKRGKPVSIVTSDGGAHWQLTPIEEHPVSLYFLNETAGWLVTTDGLWRTDEAGKSWHKLHHFPSGMWVVHFNDEQHGFTAGSKKRAYRTEDGGEHWNAIDAAAEPPGDPKFSVYNWISFASPEHGVISGWNRPPNRFPPEFPDWMDPESAVYRREGPHLTYVLTTNDGGATWKSSSASVFGEITRIRVLPGGSGVGLIEYGNGFKTPSEVYHLDWRTGKNNTLYRNNRFATTDVWQTAAGAVYMGGIEVAGQVRGVVPGKVKVLQSRNTDASVWAEIPVDYRAVANRVIFGGFGDSLWMATDNGMILKLER